MKPHPVNARCGAFDCAYKISEMYPAGHLYRIPSSSYNYQKALSGGEISLDGSDYSPCMYELVISEQDRPKYYAVIKKTVTLNI